MGDYLIVHAGFALRKLDPADAEDKTYTWSSSADAVATVSTSGVVTAVSEGTATITAFVQSGSGPDGDRQGVPAKDRGA